ncbi:hypothetical protein ACFYO2_05540 [Streptomyces sp. NPDC006602]
MTAVLALDHTSGHQSMMVAAGRNEVLVTGLLLVHAPYLANSGIA